MKSVGRIFTLLSLVVLLFTTVATAQTSHNAVKATIPFEFAIGNQDFPAGDYTFVVTAPNFLTLRDGHGRDLTTVITGSAETIRPAAAKLRFHNDNGRYVLVQVWPGDTVIGHELYPSRTKLALAKRKTVQSAQKGSQP